MAATFTLVETKSRSDLEPAATTAMVQGEAGARSSAFLSVTNQSFKKRVFFFLTFMRRK